MLGRVSFLVRVDSAFRWLTPSLEVECASLCSFLPSFGSQGTWALLLSYLEERERTGVPTPANQSCWGLQVQGSNRGKTRLPGAADLDKSFILYNAFRYGLGYVKPRFIPRLPCSPLSVPQDYLLGPNLVIVTTARK